MPKKEKRVATSTLRDQAIRSILVVCCILLALFLDDIRKQQRLTSDLTTAYHKLRDEIENNRDTLVRVMALQQQYLDGPARSAPDALEQKRLLPELQRAGWTTAHSTGLVSSLKFDDVYPFEKLYALQSSGVDRAVADLRDFYLDGQTDANREKSLWNVLHEEEKRLLAATNIVLNAGENWRYLE